MRAIAKLHSHGRSHRPLTPAIRPFNSIRRTAEWQLSPPPIAADSGVKFVIISNPSQKRYGL